MKSNLLNLGIVNKRASFKSLVMSVVAAIVATMFVSQETSAQTILGYDINETFDDSEKPVTAPWGFTTVGANTTISIENISGSHGNVFQLYVNNGGGRRISSKPVTYNPVYEGSDGYLYIEFDWQSGTPNGASNMGFVRFLDGTNVIMDISTDNGTGNVLHLGNLDAANYNSNSATTLLTPTSGSLPRNQWYHVKAILDFSTKKIVELNILGANGGTYKTTYVSFISSTASAITKIEIEGARLVSSNVTWTTQIDNFQVYHCAATAYTYGDFSTYLASLQTTHDAETRTGAYITGIKSDFQSTINFIANSVNISSSVGDLEAARDALTEALDAFNEAKTPYTVLQAAIATANTQYATANARVGSKFLNFSAAAVATYQNAITAADTELSTVATASALDDAKTAVETAYTTLYATRVEPSGKYRIFTFGNDKDAGGKGDKRLLFVNASNQLSATTTLAAENDLWVFEKTADSKYTMKNVKTGLYINTSETLSGSSANISLTENNGNPEISDGLYFYYSIRSDETHYYRVESTTEGTSTLAIKSGQPENRHRTCFHFVELPVYTVTFNSNEGTTIGEQQVEEGGLVTVPENPTKSNNNFKGWYADASFENAWNFSLGLVTSDITLHAQWEVVTSVNGISTDENLLISNTANGINIQTETAVTVRIFAATGQVLDVRQLAAGENTFVSLPQGFYIINGKKIAVR